MHRLCHRCHAELPGISAGLLGEPASLNDDDPALFCPRCGAPQILLPDYMRHEDAPAAAAVTTGAVPPPRPQSVDWPIAIRCAASVAAVTGILAVGALIFPAASFLNTLCILTGSAFVLGLYRSRRPLARIDAGLGMRLGLLTGLMMVAAIGLGLSVTGTVERFAVHNGLASFDAEVAKQFITVEQGMAEQARSQPNNQAAALELQRVITGYLTSAEVRVGAGLLLLSVEAGLILVLTTACGTFSGLLQTRRRALQGR